MSENTKAMQGDVCLLFVTRMLELENSSVLVLNDSTDGIRTMRLSPFYEFFLLKLYDDRSLRGSLYVLVCIKAEFL